MKIGVKLVIIMIALNLVSMGIASTVLLNRAQKNITGLVSQQANDIADATGTEVQNFLEVALDSVRTLGQVMEDENLTDIESRRPVINAMLRNILEKNPIAVGIWCIWEPDALEGADRRFAGTEGSDGEGRFAPYWVRSESGIVVEVLDDYSTPGDGDYYLIPRNSGQESIGDPSYYPANGKEILMSSLAYPIKRNGVVRGVVGIDISIEEIHKIAQAVKPFGTGKTAVFSNGGVVVSHFDSTRLGKSMRDTEKDMAGTYLDDFQRAVKNGETFSWSVETGHDNEKVAVFIAPIVIGNAPMRWSFAVAVPEKTVMAPVRAMLIITVIITVITAALATLAAIILARTISKPIVNTVNILKDISEGEGDLTMSITTQARGEIGDMAKYFNLTLEKIRNLMITIKDQSTVLSNIGGELAINMTESASAVNEITANIQSIKQRVMSQTASVSETHATMEQITVNIDKLNGHVEKQGTSVSQSSSAIEEMLANIQSVTQTLVKNAGNVQNLIEASDVGRTGLQDVAADIQEITRQSEGLLEINGVMESIASQTNLLSMNAAIEAAHAGESGKGFAVVADEIRKLAESSSEQSKTISAVLKTIQEAINKITVSTNNVLDKFAAIEGGVRTVSDQESNIRNAMEEQGTGSKQILEAIGQLNEITGQVKGSSAEMLNGSKEVIQESNNLAKMSEEISLGMNEMAIGAEHINTAVNRVNELSGQNRESIDMLVKEISRFKVV